MEQPCFVYIIEGIGAGSGGSDLFKIGLTSNVDSRFKTISTASPFKLRLIATRKLPSREAARFVEGYMHYGLRAWRANGEWFRGNLTGALGDIDYACMTYFMGTEPDPVVPGEGDFERLPAFLLECGTSEDLIPDLVQSLFGVLPFCLTHGRH